MSRGLNPGSHQVLATVTPVALFAIEDDVFSTKRSDYDVEI